MLKEVLVVEGKMDTVAIKKALDADTIETGGFTLSPYKIKKIKATYKKRGIIILTDFPEAGQAFVPKCEALAHHDVGIEQAQPEAILKALSKVRHTTMTPQEEFTAMDLYHNGMSGSQSAAEKRDALGAELGIGYGNVKKMVERLNHYGVTRDEFNKALQIIETRHA